MRPTLSIRGFHIYKTALDIGAQRQLVDAVRGIVKAAPLMRPQTPSGRQMSVRMTSAGRVGWTATASGYQYATRHPSGVAWPAIPREILDVWSSVTCDAPLPDSCLINFYDEAARMGLHRDHDEADFQWPVVSISLGDEGLLRVGGLERGGTTESIWLQSGDVVVMGGQARLAYHGIDRIKGGSSRLLPNGGRLNLTLRVAT